MSEDQEDGGGDARTERPHRADGGDAVPPQLIGGERIIQGKDDDSGERAILIPFIGRRSRLQFKQITLPAEGTPQYGAITDWLNFTFPMAAAGGDVARVVERVLNLLGPKAAPVEQRHGRAHFYDYAFDMGEAGAIICHGGNNGTCLVSLSGEACSLIQNWEMLAELGRDEFKGHITRWDGAVDDYMGEHSVDLALELWESKQFGTGGNQPRMRQVGNWHRPDGSGRTIYIGKRKNGKCLRVYEKGKQLGAPTDPWVRWEVTFGSRDRIVPWEVLTEPGPHVTGAYPKALSWVSKDMSRIATIQKQTQIGYESLRHHASRAFGPFISIMLKVEGSADKVVEKLQREGTPKRLKHPFIDNPDEWLE